MKTLDKCEDLYGSYSERRKNIIMDYVKEPSFEKWNYIAFMNINREGVTIWEVVCKLDPNMSYVGRMYNNKGEVIKEWDYLPNGFVVLRAIDDFV